MIGSPVARPFLMLCVCMPKIFVSMYVLVLDHIEEKRSDLDLIRKRNGWGSNRRHMNRVDCYVPHTHTHTPCLSRHYNTWQRSSAMILVTTPPWGHGWTCWLHIFQTFFRRLMQVQWKEFTAMRETCRFLWHWLQTDRLLPCWNWPTDLR